MGIERVILEDHRNVAVFRRDAVDPLFADVNVALRNLLQSRDHPEYRRLPATRGPDEHDELAIRNLEADVIDRVDFSALFAGINLEDVFEGDLGHEREAPN